MSEVPTKEDWIKYYKEELAFFTPILKKLGYTLNKDQPHLYGERYLMHSVTTKSGKKLILLGHSKENGDVVIKVSQNKEGIKEIIHEKKCRNALSKINFAYDSFTTPKEIYFRANWFYVISIQQYIKQKTAFIDRPLQEQLTLIIKAFKLQETARATTSRHLKSIKNTFGRKNTNDYLIDFITFKKSILNTFPEYKYLLERVQWILNNKKITIERYGQFLTHTDFVPHNFRIQNETFYLLDHSSLRFGNKHEGWARFINFMILYKPELAKLLTKYVKENRTPEESLSLWLMQIYRLTELIFYYTNTLPKSVGDLKKLNTTRVHFWATILKFTLNKESAPETIRLQYIEKRDSLRSDQEKKRQHNLH